MRSGVEMNINMYIGMVYDLSDPTDPAGHAGKLSSRPVRERLASSDGLCSGTREQLRFTLPPCSPTLFGLMLGKKKILLYSILIFFCVCVGFLLFVAKPPEGEETCYR